MSTADRLMTTEEFMELPDDDGVERFLMNGILYERITGPDERESIDGVERRPIVTTRGYPHSYVMVQVAYLLRRWVYQRPHPRGRVIAGGAKVRLKGKPGAFVGIDVGYISAELAAATPRLAKYIDGVPTLIVEILSPSDTAENVLVKVGGYVEAGVPVVWVVDPGFETVTVHRAGALPIGPNKEGTIAGEPELPGLIVRVEEVFED